MENFNFYHQVSYSIAAQVIVCLALTIAAAILYGIFSTRIVAGYKEVRHTGKLQPKLTKINKIKRWAKYRRNGEGRYTVLFSSNSTDGFVAIFCGLQMMTAVIKYHWFGIYQTAMNIDGSYLADANGFLLAVLAIVGGASIYSVMLYKTIQFTQFLRAIALSESIRTTGEYPHYAQRRSIGFFIECMKAEEIETTLVKKTRPTYACKKHDSVTVMLNDSIEAREARHHASMEGYYSKNPPKASATNRRNNITMRRVG